MFSKTQLPQAMYTAQQLIATDILWQIAPAIHIAYTMTHLFLKLSIVLQYIRISVMDFEKRLCYALVTIIICGSLSFFVVALTTCIPIHAIWTPNVPGAVCVDTTASFTANQVYQILLDFAILIGPFLILRHLTIPWPQRILLGFVLALGAM